MGRRFKRVAAALAAVTAFAVSACGSGGAGETASGGGTLSVALQENYATYLLEVGIAQGYFKDAGITGLKTTLFTSLPAMFAAVQKGQLDFGMQTMPALASFNATAGANPLKSFETFGNTNFWYVGKNSGLPDITSGDWQSIVRSWKGHTIGVPALGSIMEKRLRSMLKTVGLNPDKDVKIAVAGVATSAAALEKGVVDVVTVTTPNAAQIETKSLGRLAVNDESGPEEFRGLIATSLYFTAGSSLKARPGFYQKIATGMEKARAFVTDPKNKETCVRVLSDKVGLSPAIAAKAYEFDHDGVAAAKVSEASYQKSIDSLVSSGIMTRPTPLYKDMIATDSLGG
ncbi:ABC transporter substrate-binding protein [Amycolatopsis sp. NPDC005232]|uniref:ABC transporter substrate-binding protein n=1 Tax=Amycolatopsis sp. NPDC005232 TaxID=3157027 RepID=UPI0033AFEAB6